MPELSDSTANAAIKVISANPTLSLATKQALINQIVLAEKAKAVQSASVTPVLAPLPKSVQTAVQSVLTQSQTLPPAPAPKPVSVQEAPKSYPSGVYFDPQTGAGMTMIEGGTPPKDWVYAGPALKTKILPEPQPRVVERFLPQLPPVWREGESHKEYTGTFVNASGEITPIPRFGGLYWELVETQYDFPYPARGGAYTYIPQYRLEKFQPKEPQPFGLYEPNLNKAYVDYAKAEQKLALIEGGPIMDLRETGGTRTQKLFSAAVERAEKGKVLQSELEAKGFTGAGQWFYPLSQPLGGVPGYVLPPKIIEVEQSQGGRAKTISLLQPQKWDVRGFVSPLEQEQVLKASQFHKPVLDSLTELGGQFYAPVGALVVSPLKPVWEPVVKPLNVGAQKLQEAIMGGTKMEFEAGVNLIGGTVQGVERLGAGTGQLLGTGVSEFVTRKKVSQKVSERVSAKFESEFVGQQKGFSEFGEKSGEFAGALAPTAAAVFTGPAAPYFIGINIAASRSREELIGNVGTGIAFGVATKFLGATGKLGESYVERISPMWGGVYRESAQAIGTYSVSAYSLGVTAMAVPEIYGAVQQGDYGTSRLLGGQLASAVSGALLGGYIGEKVTGRLVKPIEHLTLYRQTEFALRDYPKLQEQFKGQFKEVFYGDISSSPKPIDFSRAEAVTSKRTAEITSDYFKANAEKYDVGVFGSAVLSKPKIGDIDVTAGSTKKAELFARGLHEEFVAKGVSSDFAVSRKKGEEPKFSVNLGGKEFLHVQKLQANPIYQKIKEYGGPLEPFFAWQKDSTGVKQLSVKLELKTKLEGGYFRGMKGYYEEGAGGKWTGDVRKKDWYDIVRELNKMKLTKTEKSLFSLNEKGFTGTIMAPVIVKEKVRVLPKTKTYSFLNESKYSSLNYVEPAKYGALKKPSSTQYKQFSVKESYAKISTVKETKAYSPIKVSKSYVPYGQKTVLEKTYVPLKTTKQKYSSLPETKNYYSMVPSKGQSYYPSTTKPKTYYPSRTPSEIIYPTYKPSKTPYTPLAPSTISYPPYKPTKAPYPPITPTTTSYPPYKPPITSYPPYKPPTTNYPPYKPPTTNYPPPSSPPLVFPKSTQSFSSRKGTPGYIPELKVKGKFRSLSEKPLSFAQALNVGKRFAAGTSAATFRLKPVKAVVQDFGERAVLGLQFYGKKGQPLTFVERTKFRINEPGEKQEITVKGLATLRGMRFFGGRKK